MNGSWQEENVGKVYLSPWSDFPFTLAASVTVSCCTWCWLISTHQVVYFSCTNHTFHLACRVPFATAHRTLRPWSYLPPRCGTHLFSAHFAFWYKWWLLHVLAIAFADLLTTFACLWLLVLTSYV